MSAWDLMVHVQAAHMINIYELGVPKCANGTQHSSPSTSPNHKVRKNASDAPLASSQKKRHFQLSQGQEIQPEKLHVRLIPILIP